jgi:hypothetical protein
MRDRTRHGALLRADILRSVPGRVQLRFPADNVCVNARVCWFDAGSFGVEFDTPVEHPASRSSHKDRAAVVTTHLERAGI